MPDDELVSPFRPRARLLQLLGDQLIGSPRLAVLELVKNAYDADASQVEIILENVDKDDARIIINDDGDGMSLETIRDIWLVPGHDHRGIQRSQLRRTRRGRLPLGEKGLGRFAVHKLGDEIELITRADGEDECYLRISWGQLSDTEFLEDAFVHVGTRSPTVFVGEQTGTQITVGSLRGEPWTSGQIRWLQRQVLSITSPFGNRSDEFRTSLSVPDHPAWLDQVVDAEAILNFAPWKFDFSLEDGLFKWAYSFRGVSGIDVQGRDESDDDDRLPEEAGVKNAQYGIGPLRGTVYVFDRDAAVLKRIGRTALIRQYLNENGGIRVYRDGIRVYNYGEPGEDWLGLDVRRINTPSERISSSIVVGVVDLDLASSQGLIEKTNREGFIENDAYARLQLLMLAVIARLEVERNLDKRLIREEALPSSARPKSDVSEPLEKIRALAQKKGFSKEVEPLVKDALDRFDRFKATMLRSNLSGMALVVVFHELEHSIKLLVRAGESGASAASIAQQASTIARLLDGFGDIVRKGEIKSNSIRSLFERVASLNAVRFSHHGVSFVSPIVEEEDDDVQLVFSFGLLLGAISNVFDNAFFWMATDEHRNSRTSKSLFLGFDPDFLEGPAIVIADNGPGFEDTPDQLTEPFFTRRPNGMGVGLYYVTLAMEIHGGRLAFPTSSQVRVPPEFTGAIVALVFPEGRSK